jgi:hypothetical protein
LPHLIECPRVSQVGDDWQIKPPAKVDCCREALVWEKTHEDSIDVMRRGRTTPEFGYLTLPPLIACAACHEKTPQPALGRIGWGRSRWPIHRNALGYLIDLSDISGFPSAF